MSKFVLLMKYVLISFIFILVSSCKFKNTSQGNDLNANYIMQEYPWTLDMNVITIEEADSIFDFIESNLGIDYSQIVLEKPAIKIKYTYGQYNEILTEESFILHANNGKSFSAREILFKINNETSKKLKDDPHYFFEGLEFQGYENEIATYQIMQGS